MLRPFTERRRHTRRRKPVSAWLRFRAEQAQWSAVSIDLSEGGARFATNRTIPTGEPVLLFVQLEPTQDSIECKGRVVWSQCLPDGTGSFGVHFIDLSNEEQGTFERFLSDGGEIIRFAVR